MRKYVSLDTSVDLPEEVVSVAKRGGTLYIARDNPAFMFLSDLESTIFRELLAGRSIRSATAHVACPSSGHLVPEIEDATHSLFAKIEQSGFYRGVSNPQEKAWPLHLYITNRCNLRCRTCYKEAGLPKQNELSTPEIYALLDAFSSQGPSSVVLSGGEPLTHPDFFSLAEYAKRRNHRVSVVSNGLLIPSKEEAKRIADTVDFFQISLDGASPAFNDAYRGEGTYERIVEKIDLFTGLDFTLNVGMVVSGENFQDIHDHLGDLLNRLENKRLKVNVSNIMDFGRGMYCLNKGSRDLVHRIIRRMRELGVQTKQWDVLNIRTYDCGFARSITVDSDGQTYYCPVTHPFTSANLNVRDAPFSEILRHFKEVNASSSVEHMPQCHGCELTYLCGGGCRIENMRRTGSFTGHGICDLSRKEMIHDEMVLMREG